MQASAEHTLRPWKRLTTRGKSSSVSTSAGRRTAGSRLPAAGEPYSHRDPAAERHRHAAHGPRVPAHADGHADAPAPHGRRQHAVAARHRSRRHRDADGRRAAAERRRQAPPRSRPRGVRRARVAMEGAVRRHDLCGRSGASAIRSTGRATASRWTKACPRVVTEVFVRLHEDGLIYRGKRLVNWDPVLHTALSDLEVLSEPEQGHLWHLRYPLADGSGHLVVATTRPETMLGDTAVAVHPEDERYRHLVGKQIRLPLADRLIPIIADEYVDPAFGSGCVKITPGHDFNDYEIGKRHDLPLINIFDANAALNDEVPQKYRGLDRFEARKRVVADLEALGLLEKIEPHTLHGAARRSQRRGARAVADRSVVRAHRAARRARDQGGRRRPHALRAGELVEGHTSSGCTTSRTGASAASCGGATRSRRGTTSTATSTSRARKPKREAQARGKLGRDVQAHARRGRARHVVLLRAVAVLDARLAGADAGAEDVLSDQRAGHRLRHHLLLGRAHDDDGPEVRRRRAVPRGLHHRADPRRARRQDVEVQGQHHRPARPDRRHRPRVAGRQAHQRPDAAAAAASASRRTRASSFRRASRRTAPTRCASRSARSRRWAATSASTSAASTATRTSATSCGTPRATC